jgi:hypothetical protein
MSHFLDFGINLQALGIGWGTLLMFVMMVGLLLSSSRSAGSAPCRSRSSRAASIPS